MESTRQAITLSFDVSAIPVKLGGVGRYVAGLLDAMNRQTEISLTLVSRTGDVDRWQELAPRATIRDLAPNSRPLRIAWEQARLPKIVDKLGVQLHHGPHYTFPESASVRKITTIHDMTFFSDPTWHVKSKVSFFKRAIRVATKSCDGLIFDSEMTRSKLVERFQVQGKTFVIPLAVNHKVFNPNETDQVDDVAQLTTMGISGPYVLYLGTVEPRKDVPTLVRAFDRMSSAHPELKLIIAGSPGWAEKELQRAISNARFKDKIIRKGYIPDVAIASLIRGAQVVAYPSIEEGFGLPVLEAMACATPVVTTSGTAMEEVGKGAALLVEPGDVRGLAGILDMVVRGDESLKSRVIKGLEIAGKYTWEAACRQHIDAYRSVIG
jgi:glycosyltransferase involved in cell wall biosynthesis